MKISLSQKILELQAQREAGVLSDDSYRLLTAEAVEVGQVEKDRAALKQDDSIQPLTGDVGLIIKKRCQAESWQLVAVTLWKGVKCKQIAVAAVFCFLVGFILLLVLFDESTGGGAMPDFEDFDGVRIPLSTSSAAGVEQPS